MGDTVAIISVVSATSTTLAAIWAAHRRDKMRADVERRATHLERIRERADGWAEACDESLTALNRLSATHATPPSAAARAVGIENARDAHFRLRAATTRLSLYVAGDPLYDMAVRAVEAYQSALYALVELDVAGDGERRRHYTSQAKEHHDAVADLLVEFMKRMRDLSTGTAELTTTGEPARLSSAFDVMVRQ